MNNAPYDTAPVDNQAPAAPTFLYQGTPPVPPGLTRAQKVKHFCLGLGLGFGAIPALSILAGFLETMLRVYFLFPGLYALLLPLGIILSFRKAQRFFGLGILAALLISMIVAALLIVGFIILWNQTCQQSPASCG